MSDGKSTNSAGCAKDGLLDQGYIALQNGNWPQADQIFNTLLIEPPCSGLACLGKAMAAKQLHSRNDLAAHWLQMQQDPEFQGFLKPAPPDFHRWLQNDMEKAVQAEEAPLSYMDPKRKRILYFAGIQVFLLFAMGYFMANAHPDQEHPIASFFANLLLAVFLAGTSVILGLLYGNSIVKGRKFQTLLKILNNLSAILGCIGYGMLEAVGFLSLFEETRPPRSDFYYFIGFGMAFLIHLLSLIIPMILKRIEHGNQAEMQDPLTAETQEAADNDTE